MQSIVEHPTLQVNPKAVAPDKGMRCLRRGWLPLTTACLMAGGLVACKEATTSPPKVSSSENLRFIKAYPLNLPEPSGLSLSKDKESLWTASDDEGGIYHIGLQGQILGYFPTAYKDLEGITMINSEHLAFIEERTRQIIISDIHGQIIRQAPLPFPGSDNKGPEALTYDEDSAEFHIVKEHPGILLTLNANLEETGRRELKFARDYSSISFDSERRRFWVLSDLSKSIHVLDENLNPIQSFSTNIDQLEGLAVNHEKGRIYLISDPLEMLFVFEFDPF